MVSFAVADVPEWSYEAMSELADDGFVSLPAGDVHSLTRQQMAMLTAKAMKNIEQSNELPGTSSEAANHIAAYAALSAQDAAQYKMLKDKEADLTGKYRHLINSIQKNSQNMTYGSMQTTDNTALLKKVQAKEAKDEADLSDVAVRLHDVRTKLTQYQYIMDAWKEKQKELMTQTVSMADKKAQVTAPNAAMQTAAKLRVEFAPELSQAGYYDTQAAKNVAIIETPPVKAVDLDKRFKIDGEVRYDFRHNTNDYTMRDGKRKYPDDLHRMRERLYMDYDVDGNWHILGMLESEKALKGDGKNGQIRLDRYYVQGHIGEALVTAGAFGALMAEGNIYDSRFKGAMVEFGDAVKYRLRAGNVDQAQDVYSATATYNTDTYGLDAGIYRFNGLNFTKTSPTDSSKSTSPTSDRTIVMANFRKPLGAYDFGAMYLHGIDDQAAGGNGNGYIFTLSHGKYNSWLPGNIFWYAKYYHQPQSTYVEHTMNGMADWMDGFRGPGFGLSYTLHKNLVLNLEYDMLNDLETGERNNTYWAGLSWFFSNYESD